MISLIISSEINFCVLESLEFNFLNQLIRSVISILTSSLISLALTLKHKDSFLSLEPLQVSQIISSIYLFAHLLNAIDSVFLY